MENYKERALILRIAKEELRIANKSGWGIGECRYNMNESAMMENEECSAYDFEKSNEQCKDNHAEHLKEARRIGGLAYEKACAIDDAMSL